MSANRLTVACRMAGSGWTKRVDMWTIEAPGPLDGAAPKTSTPLGAR